jgi:diguanylate cyclase (GGDEF)-like protein
MARKNKISDKSGYTILLVDDNLEYREATRFLLEHEGHAVLTAENGAEALSIIKENPVDLLLLDYYMPGLTGEEVVDALRQFNPTVQVILQTGYASEQPPRELLRRLDIQGYYDKSEGPEKLLLWVDVGLKAAYSIQLLTKSREGLKYILDITPEMHKIQSLTDLLQGILWQVSGLLGVVNSFLAVLNQDEIRNQIKDGKAEGFVALINDDTDLVVHASTGRFASNVKVSEILDQGKIRIIREIFSTGDIKLLPDITIVPLKVGEITIGMIYLDRHVIMPEDQELLNVFANQAAVAIKNVELYELATVDQLTGLYVRSFFERRLTRELRTSFRSHQVLSFLMVDLDKLKRINDIAGHLAGDDALATVGDILRQATRETDIIGRYGGDEFTIILPHTNSHDAAIVGQRIISLFEGKTISSEEGDIPLRGSVGLSTLEPNTIKVEDIRHTVPMEYFDGVGTMLIKSADVALYVSKKAGGCQLNVSLAANWPPLIG